MTLIMGVLNVTPDSFSDGGEFLDPSRALEHARAMVQAGADIIDVGGESTRPGSERVDPKVEQARILPVVEELAAEGLTLSVDTLHAETAEAAIVAGASIVNDVSGGSFDPNMFGVIAGAHTSTGEPIRYVLGHWRGIPDPGHGRSQYDDVVRDVVGELSSQVRLAREAGIRDEQLILDPGIGFDKTAAQGWQLLANLDELAALGYPVMIGVSRKRMLGELDVARTDLATGSHERDLPTAVVSALMAERAIWAVRVHNVAATHVAFQVQQALREAKR